MPATPQEQITPNTAAIARKKFWKRARLAIECGILLFMVLVYFLVYPIYLTGKGPAGRQVDASLFRTPWTDRKVMFIGIGDSITHGFGARDGYSFFDRLAKNPPDEFPDMRSISLSTVLPNMTVMNLSMSGTNSIGHAAAQIPRIHKQAPDVMGLVIITTGGNDIIHDYGHSPPQEGAMCGATLQQAQPWIDAYERRLNEMLTAIEERFPGGCHIFLGNIYDPTDGGGIPLFSPYPEWRECMEIFQKYNEVIARCAAAHKSVHLVDIYREFLGHGVACKRFWRDCYHSDDPTFWYLPILEDPTERGYDALRRLFLAQIAKVLSSELQATSKPRP